VRLAHVGEQYLREAFFDWSAYHRPHPDAAHRRNLDLP